MNDRCLGALLAALVLALAPRCFAQAGQTLDEREAVRVALANNATLAVAGLEVDRARQGVLAEEGRYPYVYQADAGYTRTIAPRLGSDDTVTSSTSHSYTVGSALRRTFPFGTQAELRVQGERFERDLLGAATTADPSIGSGYGVTARASVVQPLLRGAGTGVGEAELRAAQVNRQVAEKGRSRFTSELVRDVLVAYWELWYAAEAVEIEKAAVELANRQAEQAEQQLAAGALAPTGVLTFTRRVAELQEAVVEADTQRQQRALELARLLGAGNVRGELAAASAPRVSDVPVVTRADVEAALRAGSLELAELEAQVRLAQTRAETAGEANRPRLDVEGWVETQGVSERIPRAAERAAQMNWVSAHAGIVFELPLDDTRKNAERQSALLAVRIAQQNLKAARDRIGADATLGAAREQAARRRLVLAEKTLNIAQQNYEAERARFELGQSIAIQVQEVEDSVRRARLRVARARVDLAQAEAELLHLAGRLTSRYARV